MAISSSAVRSLLSARAVRERAHELLAHAGRGSLQHWRVHREHLAYIADYVLDTIQLKYPDLDIPFHARWRHFHDRAGKNLWDTDLARFGGDRAARARAEFDLAIVSVLLDAGAGPDWTYRDSHGASYARSEGLAIASLDMFEVGCFSMCSADPLRADASKLRALRVEDLQKGFQASAANPLAGLEGRVDLLRALGRAVAAQPEFFGRHDGPRPGGLYDHLDARAQGQPLPAPEILAVVLDYLGPIWPSRLSLDDVPLGDTWHHPLIKRNDATHGLIPFHKLSQWLSYSLIEPLQRAGIAVTEIDGLTGLPEYRNGGLFMDLGAISLKDPSEATRAHEPSSPLIVEWRALTVALLDEVAILIRAKLGQDAQSLPLAKVLEGGTWAAGRRIAGEKREGGGPPLSIVSDGTVF
ncbi:URC4/urg3 family protein [Methylovirgula sp. 4M-Z18]|uniref:URC4/urg3 family protein n=1 Tax=Methylovirgula sp. 4M-Z18 TaxID=2293567 RepID=UPI000E2FDDE8|nr:URC4/urg3 family protein [Methylovirgula sp. 4M-Z18]RFB81263.1 DUF1688 family protein [Methylovirgula sp. 4M-Z18]